MSAPMTNNIEKAHAQRPFTTSASDGRRGSRSDGSSAPRRRLAALGGAQLGRAGARVVRDLVRIGDYRALGEDAETSAPGA